MKETGIIMSGSSVTGILEDRKTLTRRLRGLKMFNELYPYPESIGDWNCENGFWFFTPVGYTEPVFSCHCPYGVPGDRLWVRESWHLCPEVNPIKTTFVFRADSIDGNCPNCGKKIKWKPSIHMPRWASRITLEIVDVRPERLQEITEEDALAEGVLPDDDMRWNPIQAYEHLWGSIDPRYPWESNPVVWRIEFRRAGR